MSRLNEYRNLEHELERHRAELERMEQDPGLQKDIEFETKLLDLLGSYQMALADVMAIFEPGFGTLAAKPKPEKPTRPPREVKVYRNPLTGETVESRGGNNKLLGAWKDRFGAVEVESWVQRA